MRLTGRLKSWVRGALRSEKQKQRKEMCRGYSTVGVRGKEVAAVAPFRREMSGRRNSWELGVPKFLLPQSVIKTQSILVGVSLQIWPKVLLSSETRTESLEYSLIYGKNKETVFLSAPPSKF